MNMNFVQELRDSNRTWNTPSADPSFACIRCWKLKKKCDKSSPQCKRCSSAGINCVYSEQPPTGRTVVTRTHQANKPSAAHPSVGSTPGMASFPVRKELPKLEVAAQPAPRFFPVPNDELPSPDSDSATDFPFSNPTSVSRFAAPIYTPFHAIKHEIGEIFALYLQTLNTWLPIISHEQVSALSIRDESTPDAETCTLLLAIYLVTKRPVDGSNMDSLYTGLKRFHSNLHTISTQSIPIIQAGMLLAIYEQGQSLHQLSYLTIGACVRMAQASGMHRTLQSDLNHAGPRQAELQQQRHVWWCLVILERILSLQNLDEGPPFASSSPNLHDYLPSYWPLTKIEDGVIQLGSSSNIYSKFPEIEFPHTNPLAKSVQATYLLAKVFEHISSTQHTADFRQAEADYLDSLLRAFMERAMEDSYQIEGESWNHSCVPFYILMCAMLRLHTYTLSCNQHGSDPAFAASSQRSIMALKMIARVGAESRGGALEVADTTQNDFLNEFNMPPFLLTATRDVALVGLDMIKHNVDEEFWRGIVNFYTMAFRLASGKWRLADEYLKLIAINEARA